MQVEDIGQTKDHDVVIVQIGNEMSPTRDSHIESRSLGMFVHGPSSGKAVNSACASQVLGRVPNCEESSELRGESETIVLQGTFVLCCLLVQPMRLMEAQVRGFSLDSHLQG